MIREGEKEKENLAKFSHFGQGENNFFLRKCERVLSLLFFFFILGKNITRHKRVRKNRKIFVFNAYLCVWLLDKNVYFYSMHEFIEHVFLVIDDVGVNRMNHRRRKL